MRESIDEILPDAMWKAACFLLDRGRLSADEAIEAARHLHARSGVDSAGRLGSAALRAGYWYLMGHAAMSIKDTLAAVHASMLAQEYIERARTIMAGKGIV